MKHAQFGNWQLEKSIKPQRIPNLGNDEVKIKDISPRVLPVIPHSDGD
jgi:hypothetical protein